MESEHLRVIDFWFRELTPSQWFTASGPELDELVRARFGTLVEEARRGALDHWADSPRGRLALIIVLDQFPRHVFRGALEAYSSDPKAQRLACEGIEARADEQLTAAERQFFYLPLMHSESLADQDLCVCLVQMRLPRTGADNLHHGALHRDVIRRFGRFPSRNRALGRADTQAERAYREAGGYMG